MGQSKREKVFFNRADVSNVLSKDEGYFEEIVFALRSKDGEFSVGLSTVLECLKFAEDEGVVPQLPDGWWTSLWSRYHIG